MGESVVARRLGLTAPAAPGKAMRFFKGKNLLPPGSLYSMAKPTKSVGGLPSFQFMATRVMPSPRWSFRVKRAAGFWPVTWNSALMADPPGYEREAGWDEPPKRTLNGRRAV